MAPESATSSAQKRKAHHHDHVVRSSASKRQKTQAIRAIPSQSSDAALSRTGELDVGMFVKAREYEIRSLEKSMQNTRHGLATRAFQQVPRNMRRRTASHNVMKVPRRLRRRAEKEMKEDNTPTITSRRRIPSSRMRLRLETAKRIRTVNSKLKSATARKKAKKRNGSETDPEAHVPTTPIPKTRKNQLADPPEANSKFKKRQVHKTWLPTHLWHAKRAHMTKPSEPLWRMAIPLSPTEKGFRPSHRASGGRGAVAWDMSYVATIGCEGTYASLVAMLKDIGVGENDEWGNKGTGWRKGSRSVSGWAHEMGNDKRVIGPITVLWAGDAADSIQGAVASNKAEKSARSHATDATTQPITGSAPLQQDQSARRKILLRVHPAAFHQLWTEISRIALMQHPLVAIDDLRFEIASVDIIGPSSTEALSAVLQPIKSSELPMTCSAQTWTNLCGLTNPASLPMGAMLGFTVLDPRLEHPTRPTSKPATDDSNDELTDLVMDWPPDRSPPDSSILSQKARVSASRSLPSQKAVNRRKGEAPPFEAPLPQDTDPQIPVMLLASRPGASAAGAQGAWTVLLPWKCLDPVWRCLMYSPLSSGANPRFGGLEQTRQVAFEQNQPWFPGDFPGTEAGKAWEQTEMKKRYRSWKCKPPSRRVNYDSLKLGNDAKGEHGKGWACDWEDLFPSPPPKSSIPPSEGAGRKSGNESRSNLPPHPGTTQATESNTDELGEVGQASKDKGSPDRLAATPYLQLAPRKAVSILRPSSITPKPILFSQPFLATVRLTLLARGSPSACARIYRLPPRVTFTTDHSGSASHRSTASLRSLWLEQDPHATRDISRIKKIKSNHRGMAVSHSVYDDEFADLDAINCRPPDMVPAAVAEVQKKREELGVKRAKFQAQKENRKKEVEGLQGSPNYNREHDEDNNDERLAREELMRDLMRPCAERDRGNDTPPCPPKSDLIGFVTTGGYNLSVGRGTAIGAVWVQRVLEEWQYEAEQEQRNRTSRESGDDEAIKRKKMKQVDRERRLCIVRNAGESVGRLGIWEVCE